MEQFLSALTGFLVPMLVVLSIIIQIVRNARKAADRKSSEERPAGTWPSQTAYRPPSAPPRTYAAPARPVPATTDPVSPPRRADIVPRLSGSFEDGAPSAGTLEGETHSVGSLEGIAMENLPLDDGSLGGETGMRREMGIRDGIERRQAGPQDFAYRTHKRGQRAPLFRPSRDTLVRGVLYAEILGRPGGRRAGR